MIVLWFKLVNWLVLNLLKVIWLLFVILIIIDWRMCFVLWLILIILLLIGEVNFIFGFFLFLKRIWVFFILLFMWICIVGCMLMYFLLSKVIFLMVLLLLIIWEGVFVIGRFNFFFIVIICICIIFIGKKIFLLCKFEVYFVCFVFIIE